MRLTTLFITSFLFTAAQAETTGHRAQQAAFGADLATTGIGLGFAGATELNPVAPVAIPMRWWLGEKMQDYPCHARQRGNGLLSAVNGGAAVNNALVIAGVAYPLHFIGLLAAYPIYKATDDLPCQLEPLTDKQIVLLAKWRQAWLNEDADALPTDDEALRAKYRDFFQRTSGPRDVVYYNLSQTDDGFVADYEATWMQNGERQEIEGGYTWVQNNDSLSEPDRRVATARVDAPVVR